MQCKWQNIPEAEHPLQIQSGYVIIDSTPMHTAGVSRCATKKINISTIRSWRLQQASIKVVVAWHGQGICELQHKSEREAHERNVAEKKRLETSEAIIEKNSDCPECWNVAPKCVHCLGRFGKAGSNSSGRTLPQNGTKL